MIWDFFAKFVLFARSGSVVRRIAWLTIFGMVLSVAALIIVMSVMNALNQNISNRTLAVEPHLVIEIPGVSNLMGLEVHPVMNSLQSDSENKASVFESQDVILRTVDGRFRGAIARGVRWGSLEKMLKDIQKQQSDLKIRQNIEPIEKPEPGEVLVGVDLAHALGVFPGETLVIAPPEALLLPPGEVPKFEKVKVKQVLSTNISDIDSQMLYYLQGETLNQMRGNPSRKLGIEVWVKDGNNIESLANFLKRQWENIDGLKLETWKERNSALFLALRIEKFMIGTFLSIASFVASLSLISVVSLVTSQKKKEIALLQAIGLSRSGAKKLFVKIGLILAGFGLGGGLFLGLAISLYIQAHPLQILPDIYYDSQIPAKVSWVFILLVACFGAAMAYWGSKLAVSQISTQEPSNQLKGQN